MQGKPRAITGSGCGEGGESQAIHARAPAGAAVRIAAVEGAVTGRAYVGECAWRLVPADDAR
ncbi:hypothetical protein Xph01_55250 [Micromonospora phaseoli]|nr:hypothetical protein Xph01_55250 [Micromonospora phaseoli]